MFMLFTQWSRQVPREPSKGRLRRRFRSQNPSLKQAENPGTGWWDVIVQPDLSEFGARNHTISRLQKEGPHIHSDNPSSVAILQVNTFSVRLHLYIYSTILHGPLCLKLLGLKLLNINLHPKSLPQLKMGWTTSNPPTIYDLWEINPKKKKNIHPTWITHWCVRVLPGETFLRMGKLIPRIWKRLSSPMFPKVAFPYVVSTSRLGCPRGGLKDAWGLGRLGVWFMLVVGWWLMVGFQKGSVFFGNTSFLGGLQSS